jgi:hypothetical protein
MTLKEKVYHTYVAVITNKIKTLQQTLADLQESAANETKRTAGDKHETALAMLQIEQENINRQMNEAAQQQTLLNQIDPLLHATQVCRGSLVTTSKGMFFISAALGKIKLDEAVVVAVSPASPIGTNMMNLKTGDHFSINGTHYSIEAIN